MFPCGNKKLRSGLLASLLGVRTLLVTRSLPVVVLFYASLAAWRMRKKLEDREDGVVQTLHWMDMGGSEVARP